MRYKRNVLAITSAVLMLTMLPGCGTQYEYIEKTQENTVEAVADEDYEIPKIFYSAPDGTVINIAVVDGLDTGKSEINEGNINGRTFFSGTYNGDNITVGYVEKENGDILENIEDIYISDDEAKELLGTDVKKGLQETATQLYIKAPDDDENDLYLPIALAYTETKEGYLYVVMVAKNFARITDSDFGIDDFATVLATDYTEYYKIPEEFLKNYVKISHI